MNKCDQEGLGKKFTLTPFVIRYQSNYFYAYLPTTCQFFYRFGLYTAHTADQHAAEHVKYCLPPAALITNEHDLSSNNKHVILLRIVQ
jgi:hypothetical protein